MTSWNWLTVCWGLRRKRRKYTDLRAPVNLGLLHKLIRALPIICSSNYQARLFASAFSLLFFGLLRIGEITTDSKSVPGCRISKLFVTQSWIDILSERNHQNEKIKDTAEQEIVPSSIHVIVYLDIHLYFAGKEPMWSNFVCGRLLYSTFLNIILRQEN
jgi:hypothetical protein